MLDSIYTWDKPLFHMGLHVYLFFLVHLYPKSTHVGTGYTQEFPCNFAQTSTSLSVSITSSTTASSLPLTSPKTYSSGLMTSTPASRCRQVCPCINLTIDSELEEVFEDRIQKLSVNRTTTSKHRRQLTSAEDERTSAKTIGVFGVVFLTVTFSTVVFVDIPAIMGVHR